MPGGGALHDFRQRPNSAQPKTGGCTASEKMSWSVPGASRLGAGALAGVQATSAASDRSCWGGSGAGNDDVSVKNLRRANRLERRGFNARPQRKRLAWPLLRTSKQQTANSKQQTANSKQQTARSRASVETSLILRLGHSAGSVGLPQRPTRLTLGLSNKHTSGAQTTKTPLRCRSGVFSCFHSNRLRPAMN
jgi:hypothetical protein